MKFHTIEVVFAEDVADDVRDDVKKNGGINPTARMMGESRQAVANLIHGVQSPSAKIIDYKDLEKIVAYRRKDQSQGK